MHDAPEGIRGCTEPTALFLESIQLSLRVPLVTTPASAIGVIAPRTGGEDLESRARALAAREQESRNGASTEERLEMIRLLARADRDRAGEMVAAAALGLLYLEGGAWDLAIARFQDALRVVRNPLDRAFCWFGEAAARAPSGAAADVISSCARGTRSVRRTRDPMLRARILRLAAQAYRTSGDLTRCRRACDRIRDIPTILDRREQHAFLRLTEADLLRGAGRLEAAMAACDEACDLLKGHPHPIALLDPSPVSALRRLGEILFELSRFEDAREKALQGAALETAGPYGAMSAERGRIALLIARLDLERGNEEAGWGGFQAAEEAFRRMNARRDLGLLLLLRGEQISMRETRHSAREAAREGVFEARAILRPLGARDLVARCDVALEVLRARPATAGACGGQPARPPRVPRMRRLTQLGFLTADPRILASLEPLESLARTSIPILILGESGTGKEVLAHALHRASGRRGPFVAVNCGALPSELQESELFGHVRGAFTGAVADKIGLFEAADGGILLLDEVGEMTSRAQVKLLRILELGEVRRVGETRTRRVQVRVIAATNADLVARLRDGTFRMDLYYRLCGLKVDLPPLRERLGDVPLLAAHFARIFSPPEEAPPSLSPDALDRLMRHPWPGNVRELRFTIERAIALSIALDRTQVESDCICIEPPREDAPQPPSVPACDDIAQAGGLEAFLENTERRLILKALEESGWNRTRAARSLGSMSRTTLIGKMKRLGLFPTSADARDEDRDEVEQARLL